MAAEGAKKGAIPKAVAPPTAGERFITSPEVGTIVVVLGILTGLIGSIYPTALQQLVQQCVPVTPRAAAFAFFGFAALTGAAVFWRQRVVDVRREAVQRRFDAAAHEIPELIRTLPDPAFLTNLGVLYQKHALLAADIKDIEKRLEAILVVLQGFAALAQRFDGREAGGRYAANLMVFVSGANAEPWANHVKFFDGNPEKLRGLLVLPRGLSALVDGPDDTLPEFALPVPDEMGEPRHANGHGWKVLPGAPMAFHTKQLEHFQNAAELATFCDDSCDLTKQVKAELREYFIGHAASIGGFLSTAICSPRTGEVLGVLNVHWDSSWRLSSTHAAQLFKEATFPLQVILAQILEGLLAERPPKPADAHVDKPPDVPASSAAPLAGA